MFFTRYSNIGIGQKYRYYIGRYRYQQKWPISADTDIGSTLVLQGGGKVLGQCMKSKFEKFFLKI